MEERFLLWLQELRTPFWDTVTKAVTHLGDGGLIFIVATLLLIVLPKTRYCGIACAISLTVDGILCNLVLKNIFARTRPYEMIDGLSIIIEKQSDYSFPSGHAGIACAFAGAVLLYCITKTKRKLPLVFGIVSVAFALFMCFTRLYVGVHYPSDVLGGIAVGAFSAFLGYILTEKIIVPKTVKDRV